MLLIGGDKTGMTGGTGHSSQRADKIYDRHVEQLREEGGI